MILSFGLGSIGKKDGIMILCHALQLAPKYCTITGFTQLDCPLFRTLKISRICVDANSLCQAKQAHALAILHSVLPHHVPTCATLILSYATFGDISSARLLFYQFLHRTTFLYNTLIKAHTICGDYHYAFSIYNEIARHDAVRPDDHTFPFIIKACADVAVDKKGLEIHGAVIKLGFDSDVFVNNTLLSFYGSTKNLTDARRVFDEMLSRDVISWNSIIAVFSDNGCFLEAIQKFLELYSENALKPNVVSVVSVLPACVGSKDENITRQIHGYVAKTGLHSEITICNALIDAYGKCGNSVASELVFEEMEVRNIVTWNSIIGSLGNFGKSQDSVTMFKVMLAADVRPNSITFAVLLPLLIELQLFDNGKELHAYALKTRTEFDVFVANSLIDMYAKFGCLKEASSVFYELEEKNVVSWNAMVANFTLNGCELEAIRLLHEMQDHGECPNSVTFTNVLPACGRIAALRKGKEIHARSIRMAFSSDIFVSNALIDMYAKCGQLVLARNVFEGSERDEVSFNTVIVGYSDSSNCSESLHLFHEMRVGGFKCDTISFMGVLSACGNLNAIRQGKQIHGHLIRKSSDAHLFVANSILDMYSKCGRIDLARIVFDRMVNRDVASWNSMILGYGMQGQFDLAVDLFDKMKDGRVEYDHVSYLAALSACSHGGMIERGKLYYNEMVSHNVRPTQMHFACMVDLFGRAGLMKEASNFIRSLPIEPDANVWGALLGASRIHKNIEMGKWAADHLFELKPNHSGYYILLSNMYAEAGKWDEANRVRDLMRSKQVTKDPGFSWVESSDRMQSFKGNYFGRQQQCGGFNLILSDGG